MTKLFTITISAIFFILASSSHGHEVDTPLTDRCQETSDLRSLAVGLSDKDSHAQLQSMTNILHATFGSKNLCDVDIQLGCYLLKRTLALPSVRNDPNVLYYCARTISSATGVSTNAYETELFDAYTADMALRKEEPRKPGIAMRGKYWGPNLKAFHAKWTPILEHNRALQELREYGVRELRDALSFYSAGHGVNASQALKTRILALQSLSDDERKRLVGDEFFSKAITSEAERQKVQ